MSSGFFVSATKIFFEGMWAFILPCILPMLPVYLMYLSGSSSMKDMDIRKRLKNTLGFVLGFTILFMLMGAGASVIGRFLLINKLWLKKIAGIVLIVFGLQFLGIFNLKILNKQRKIDYTPKNATFISSMLFGAAFSLGWSPCLGPFLGEALIKASSSESILEGMALLFFFSMGLGVPFIAVSLLYEKIKPLMELIKRNYKTINIISGIILIFTGLAMTFNLLGYYTRIFQ